METIHVVEQPLNLHLGPRLGTNRNLYREGRVKAVVSKDFLRLLAGSEDTEDEDFIYDETSNLSIRMLTPPDFPSNEVLLTIGDYCYNEDYTRLWKLHNLLKGSKRSVQFKCRITLEIPLQSQSSKYCFESAAATMTMHKTGKGVIPAGVFLSKRIKMGLADNPAHLAEWNNPDAILEAKVSLSMRIDCHAVAAVAKTVERNKYKESHQRVIHRLKYLGNIVGISVSTPTAKENENVKFLTEELEKKLVSMVQSSNHVATNPENNLRMIVRQLNVGSQTDEFPDHPTVATKRARKQ